MYIPDTLQTCRILMCTKT